MKLIFLKKININKFALIFLVLLAIGFLMPNFAQASCIDDWDGCIATAFSAILHGVIWAIGLLVGIAGMIMDTALQFNNFKTDSVVFGWEVIRDLVNMMFIMVLLVVAFGTVLNIQSYNVKAILPRFIIVALLVNFSMPISLLVVDIAQILLFGFYNAMINGLSGDCALASPGVCFSYVARIVDLLKDSSAASSAGSVVVTGTSGPWQTVGNLLLAAIFLLVYAVVLSVGGIMLMVRIVGIWIAIILSPFAFFSYILPASQSFAKKWWTKFLQYAFFGPIYAFFLWISLILLSKSSGIFSTTSSSIAGASGGSDFFKYLNNVLQFIMVIVLLLWSFTVTRRLGLYGADKVTKNAEKFLWTGDNSIGKKLSGYKYGKRYKDAYESRRGDVEKSKKAKIDERYNRYAGNIKRPFGATVGAVTDRIPILGKRMGVSKWGEDQRKQAEYQRQQRVSEEGKRIEHINDGEELHNEFKKAHTTEAKEAIVKRASKIGGLDDLLIKAGYSDDVGGLEGFMKKTFGDNDKSARLAHTLASEAANAGQVQFAGVSKYNSKKKQYAFGTSPDEKAAEVFRTVGGEYPQQVARKLKKHLFITTDKNGNKSLNETGIQFLDDIKDNIDWNRQAGEIPPRVIDQLRDQLTELRARAATLGPNSGLQKLLDGLHSANITGF